MTMKSRNAGGMEYEITYIHTCIHTLQVAMKFRNADGMEYDIEVERGIPGSS